MATRRRASRQTVTGALTDLQRRVRYLQNRPSPTSLGNHSVVRSAIQPRAVDSDQIALAAITNDQIDAEAVKEAQLDTDSVTRDKIKNGEVVQGKLGTDAVIADNILDGEVKDGKLGAASVNLINMKPNSVDNGQLITDSVNFRTVDRNAIGNENMLDNSVGQSELQNDSVGNGELRSDSVGFAELQSSSVGTSTLQSTSVTNSKLAGGIDGSKISNATITGNKIAARTIASNNISTAAYPVIVSQGLATGYGINKSDNRISVNTSAFASPNHTHNFTWFYYTRDGSNRVLRDGINITRTTTRPSSKKLKKEITSHSTFDPKKLLLIELKKFKYKKSLKNMHIDSKREWMYGYIAEELKDIGIEEILDYDEDGNPIRVDYGLLSTLVLELVKVQQKEIESLQEKIKELEEKK